MAEPVVKRYWKRRWETRLRQSHFAKTPGATLRLDDVRDEPGSLQVEVQHDGGAAFGVILGSQDVAELAALLTKLAEELGARATLEALG